MSFGSLLDIAARAAQHTFGSSALYFYMERTTGERFELSGEDRPVETEIIFTVEDVARNVSTVKKGRGFLIPRPARDRLDAWLAGLGVDRPGLPYANDAIIVQRGASETRYRIDRRDPIETIGPNEALTRFNTTRDDA